MICGPATTSSTIDFPFWQPIGQSIIMLFEKDWVMREMNPPCHLLCLYCLHLKRFSFFFQWGCEGIMRGELLPIPCSRSPMTQKYVSMQMESCCLLGFVAGKTGWGSSHTPRATLKGNKIDVRQLCCLVWISSRHKCNIHIGTREQQALTADSTGLLMIFNEITGVYKWVKQNSHLLATNFPTCWFPPAVLKFPSQGPEGPGVTGKLTDNRCEVFVQSPVPLPKNWKVSKQSKRVS